MFVSDVVVLADVNAALGGRGSVPSGDFWAQTVQRAHAAAYRLIFDRLIARGYTPQQINGWDGGEAAERAIALYEALTQAGALQAVDDKLLSRYQEYVGGGKVKQGEALLDKVLLVVAGQWQAPADVPGTAASRPQPAGVSLSAPVPQSSRQAYTAGEYGIDF